MSHGKLTKRGNSLYVEKWNPSAQKYINTCALCGKRGYSPSIDEADFAYDLERKAICGELTKILTPLSLDVLGRCAQCAERMEK